jgi:hypothetical protein
MNWEAIGGLIALAGVANYLMLLSVKQTIAENNDRLREWINGSFMRSKEVDARLVAVERRLELIEDKE